VKAAAGGTLFLDELGDLPWKSSQSCCGFFRSVNMSGGRKRHPPAEVRIIAREPSREI